MTVVVDTRRDLTLDNFRRVAVEGNGIAIGRAARQAMESALRSRRLLGEARPAAPLLSAETLPERAPTTDPAGIPVSLARGVVFARLADLVEGHAACRPEIAERLAAGLDRSGTAGRGARVGESFLETILKAALEGGPGLLPEEKEALLDGSPVATALFAHAAIAGRRLAEHAHDVFALSVEAMRAPLDAYREELGSLWNDPFATEALEEMNGRLSDAQEERRPYQAPVSYRILPRVLGQAHRALAGLERAAERMLASVSLSVVYLPGGEGKAGHFSSGLGSYDIGACSAANTLSASWADLATLADRQSTKLLRERPAEGSGPLARIARRQVLVAERARLQAAPTPLPASEGGSRGEEDVVMPAALALERQVEAARLLEAALCLLASAATETFEASGRSIEKVLNGLVERVRSFGGGTAEPPGRPASLGAGP